MLTAIETTGTISAGHQIKLDEDLPKDAPERVRIIVLYDEKNNGKVGQRRKSGSAAGLIKMADDFDAPLTEFEEYEP